jgi:hypothetical protein
VLFPEKRDPNDSAFVDAMEYELAMERGNRLEAEVKYERLRIDELERRAIVDLAAVRAASVLVDAIPRDTVPMAVAAFRDELHKVHIMRASSVQSIPDGPGEAPETDGARSREGA